MQTLTVTMLRLSLLFVTDYFAPDLCLQRYVAVVSSLPTF